MLFTRQLRHREVDSYSQRRVANRTVIKIQSRTLKVTEKKCARPLVNNASAKGSIICRNGQHNCPLSENNYLSIHPSIHPFHPSFFIT